MQTEAFLNTGTKVLTTKPRTYFPGMQEGYQFPEDYESGLR